MMRFTVTILILQVTFIVAGALVVPTSPGLSHEKPFDLGMSGEQFIAVPTDRYGLPCFDINATLTETSALRDLWISVRLWTERQDYDTRREWDLKVATSFGEPRRTFDDENFEEEPGYIVRYQNRGSVYCELVRHRTNVMLIVRVSQKNIPEGREGEELSRCEAEAKAFRERVRGLSRK